MEANTIVLLVLMLIVLGCLVTVAIMTLRRGRVNNDRKLEDVIKQINEVHGKMYQFDKTLEGNLKRMEKNIEKINETNFTNNQEIQGMKSIVSDKNALAKQVKTSSIDTGNLTLGGRFMLSAIIPNGSNPSGKELPGSAKGQDWLQLTKPNSKESAGLIVGKMKVQDEATIDGSASVEKQLNVKQDVSIGKDIVLEGSNRWVLHTPDDGRSSLYIAPYTKGKWDWQNQLTIGNTGTLDLPGGLTVKGGKSTHNPRGSASEFPAKDGLNHLQGDTQVHGNVGVDGSIQFNKVDAGPMIETKAGNSDANRFGVGQFANGAMRVYTSSAHGPSSLNLSLAKEKGTFDDIVKIKGNRTFEVTGPAKFEQTLETKEVVINKPNSKHTARVSMGSSEDSVVEIYGNTGNGEKRLATFKGDGSLCLGGLCMKESAGKLQICAANGSSCRNI